LVQMLQWKQMDDRHAEKAVSKCSSIKKVTA